MKSIIHGLKRNNCSNLFYPVDTRALRPGFVEAGGPQLLKEAKAGIEAIPSDNGIYIIEDALFSRIQENIHDRIQENQPMFFGYMQNVMQTLETPLAFELSEEGRDPERVLLFLPRHMPSAIPRLNQRARFCFIETGPGGAKGNRRLLTPAALSSNPLAEDPARLFVFSTFGVPLHPDRAIARELNSLFLNYVFAACSCVEILCKEHRPGAPPVHQSVEDFAEENRRRAAADQGRKRPRQPPLASVTTLQVDVEAMEIVEPSRAPYQHAKGYNHPFVYLCHRFRRTTDGFGQTKIEVVKRFAKGGTDAEHRRLINRAIQAGDEERVQQLLHEFNSPQVRPKPEGRVTRLVPANSGSGMHVC
ncbi:MAG TPA: hypothetical protein VHB73_06260 [Alphaproteobacteria bacterium]|nr:hypothetical protein [Alphaproteobacteria bacterium]